MRPALLVLLLALTACSTPQSPPKCVLLEYSSIAGDIYEVWLRPDGTRFLRACSAGGRYIEMDVRPITP